METSVEILEGDRAKITVTIDANTIKERVRKQYREFANRYTFPGFRKGKAPRPVIDNALGKEAVAATVTDDVVNEACPLAIDESGLYPVGQPEFDENMDLVKDGTEFVFSFEIGTKPVAELENYEPVSIELPSEEVTDDEVDDEIDALRSHYAEAVDADDDTAVSYANQVDLAIRATDDNGEELATLTNDSTVYSFGSNYYPDTFEEQLIGMKKGDSKTFTIDMPTEPTIMTASVMGKTATITFDVTVNAVKDRKLPELTDEWVSSKIGMETVDELRSEIREELEGQKGTYLPRLKESRVLRALAERLKGEVPESMVDEASASLMQDFFNQLQRQGTTLDAYLKQQDITSAQFREDIKAQATDVAAQDLALDAWAASKGLEATDEDIREEFVKSGAEDPDGLMEEWRKNGQMYLIRQGILRQKAAVDAVDSAVGTEPSPIEAAEEIVEAVEAAVAETEEESEKKGKHAKSEESAEAE